MTTNQTPTISEIMLQFAIANPGDVATWSALADRAEDIGDNSSAQCYRWLAAHPPEPLAEYWTIPVHVLPREIDRLVTSPNWIRQRISSYQWGSVDQLTTDLLQAWWSCAGWTATEGERSE